MIEYLIRMLSEGFKIATLSRGYGRKTSGFILANHDARARSIGDEPFQFYSRFRDIRVAVDENRKRGIKNLLNLDVPPDVILLDDAFQHRRVQGRLSILLTAYDDLYTDDLLLPTGNLREPIGCASRADIIVVTKCPPNIDQVEKNEIIQKLKPKSHQTVYFSWIEYSDKIYNVDDDLELEALSNKQVSLVTGIADSSPLVSHFKRRDLNFEHLKFRDHHSFTKREIENFRSKPVILTTEKDYVRLKEELEKEKLWYLPIRFRIDNEARFNAQVSDVIKN